MPARTGKALEMSWATSVQDCLISRIDVYSVCARRCNTPLKYQPIFWALTTCHATTTKTPTSKRPPIHHQKYHSNATATPEKYLANIVKHSIKNISNTAKTCCFSLCLLYFFYKRLAWTQNLTTPKQDKGQHIAQKGSTQRFLPHMSQHLPNMGQHGSILVQHAST